MLLLNYKYFLVGIEVLLERINELEGDNDEGVFAYRTA
jgi:hypothetical protein